MEKAMLYPDDWGDPVPLNTVLRENKARNESLAFGKEDVLSVSGEQGVVNQIQLLGRSYAGESVAPYHIVETGDLVYTKSPLKENPYGIIKQNRGKPGIVSTLYAVYHCDNPITGQYLENYFSVDTFLNNYLKPIVKRGAKNDMKVNNEDVLLGRVPLPSVEEQRRINEVLSKTDYLIHQKLEIIENLRRMKTICLIKMFPRKGATVPELRFPGFTAPWEQRKFSDLAETRRGLTYNPSNVRASGIRILRSSNITEDQFTYGDEDVFVEQDAVNIPYANCGDILITSATGSTRLVGKHAIIRDIPNNLAVHGGFMLLATAKNPEFVNALMSAPWYSRFISLYVAGGNGAIGNLNKNDLDDQDVVVPDGAEQLPRFRFPASGLRT